MRVLKKDDWDRAAKEYQNVFALGPNEYNASLLQFWKDCGMLKPGDRIIDIGCGVGKYGTYFAELGCDVTLVDISGRMLDHARENMSRYRTPWRVYQCDFGDVSGDEPIFAEAFDLAISTMSPAVHSVETVRKMSAMTDGWCFLSQFYSWEQPLRDSVMRDLDMQPRRAAESLSADCDALLRLIREAGFAPQEKTVSYNWADRRTPEQMADYMCRSFFQDESDPAALREKLAESAAVYADENGTVCDSVNTTVKWIWWKAVKK